MTAHQHATYEVRGTAAWITFNRENKRNAWTFELVEKFREGLLRAGRDARVRAVVVSGRGTAFCAGMDLGMAQGLDSDGYRSYYLLYDELREALRWLGKPVIARVNGDAYGDGVCILECFDVILAVRHARFSLSEVKVGLHAGGLFFFDLGRARALDLSLTGRVFTAEEAERWGLVTRVVDEHELDAATAQYVETFTRLPAEALATNKRAANLVLGLAGYDSGRKVIRELSMDLYDAPQRAELMRDLRDSLRPRKR